MSGDVPVRTKPWDFGTTSTDEFGDLEREYVLRVLEKKRVFRYFNTGAEQSEALQLETLYSERLSVRRCLAVNSGTSALVAALIGAGIGPGDEVIVPAFTWVATAAAVVLARAVPVIVDVNDTLTLDPRAFESAITEHTKAVIPVHMHGVGCQMDEVMAIARRHRLVVIEDNAQANGGSYHDRPLGSIGDLGCLSFQQYKLVTAGEGGMVVTDDDEIFKRMTAYHDPASIYWKLNENPNHGLLPSQNYRMSELNAALALAQSQRIGSLVDRLRHIKNTIADGLQEVDRIRLRRVPDPAGEVPTVLIFYLATSREAQRFSELLQAEGIPNFTMYDASRSLPDLHIYTSWTYVLQKTGISEKDNPWRSEHYNGNVRYSPDMCAQTLGLLSRAIMISLHQNMTPDDCDDVVEAIRKVAAA